MNRRYWDILVQSLHNAIMKDISTIEKFTEEAIEVGKMSHCDDKFIADVQLASDLIPHFVSFTPRQGSICHLSFYKNSHWFKEGWVGGSQEDD